LIGIYLVGSSFPGTTWISIPSSLHPLLILEIELDLSEIILMVMGED
jgi:hypothetical protein